MRIDEELIGVPIGTIGGTEENDSPATLLFISVCE